MRGSCFLLGFCLLALSLQICYGGRCVVCTHTADSENESCLEGELDILPLENCTSKCFTKAFFMGNDIKLERGCLDGKKEEERQEGCIFIDLYYFTCTTVCLESFCLHTPPQVTSTTYEEAGIDIHSNGGCGGSSPSPPCVAVVGQDNVVNGQCFPGDVTMKEEDVGCREIGSQTVCRFKDTSRDCPDEESAGMKHHIFSLLMVICLIVTWIMV